MKSLLIVLLLSLFSLSLEAAFIVDETTPQVLVEYESSETMEMTEEIDDKKDDRFFSVLTNMTKVQGLDTKIDLDHQLSKQEYFLKIQKPPIFS